MTKQLVGYYCGWLLLLAAWNFECKRRPETVPVRFRACWRRRHVHGGQDPGAWNWKAKRNLALLIGSCGKVRC